MFAQVKIEKFDKIKLEKSKSEQDDRKDQDRNQEKKQESISSVIQTILNESKQMTAMGTRAKNAILRKSIDSDSDDSSDGKKGPRVVKYTEEMPRLERISKRNLTDQQEYFIERVLKRKNVLLTAPGGFGKTYALQEIADRLREKKKIFYLTATTGVAAINMIDGTDHSALTLHSWMGLGLADDPIESLVRRVFATSGIRLGRLARQRWAKAEYLFIDEVSMLDPRLIEVIHEIACAVRKNTKPFGGITVVFSGDFAQLKPVKPKANVTYAFQHELWKQFNIEEIYLTKAFRFDKQDWADILLRIRLGKETKADYKMLKTRLIDEEEEELKDSKKSIQRKKERDVLAKIVEPYDAVPDVFDFVTTEIHSTNEVVAHVNQRERNLIQPREEMIVEFEYTTAEFGRDGSNSSTLDAWLTNQKKECLSKPTIELCTGAQVMCTANIDMKSGLVNGTLGIIVGWGKLGEKKPGCSMSEIYPIVRFINGVTATVPRREWKYSSGDHKGVITYCQIPLMYSWALTFHKVQGLTLNRARMDVGDSVFTSGQAYVGLSRVKTLEGLELISLHRSSLFADNDVVEYYEELDEKQVKMMEIEGPEIKSIM